MKVIIDRFEGEYAVVETEEKVMLNIPKSLIPDASEGDTVIITVEKNKNENIKKMMNDLFE